MVEKEHFTITAEVRRMRLQPGDIICIKVKERLSCSQMQGIKEEVERLIKDSLIPDLQVLVLDNVDIGIMNKGGATKCLH